MIKRGRWSHDNHLLWVSFKSQYMVFGAQFALLKLPISYWTVYCHELVIFCIFLEDFRHWKECVTSSDVLSKKFALLQLKWKISVRSEGPGYQPVKSIIFGKLGIISKKDKKAGFKGRIRFWEQPDFSGRFNIANAEVAKMSCFKIHMLPVKSHLHITVKIIITDQSK